MSRTVHARRAAIELKDGKWLRVDAGADQEAIRRLVTLLEGATP